LIKIFNKLVATITFAGMLGTSGTALALDFKSPAQIVSELTGKTVDQVTEERVAGKGYGAIAKDAGQLEAFQNQVLEQKKAILDQRVQSGTMIQEEADQIYTTIQTRQASCDGTGQGNMRRNQGFGLGYGIKGKGSVKQGKCLGMGREAGMRNVTFDGIDYGRVLK